MWTTHLAQVVLIIICEHSKFGTVVGRAMAPKGVHTLSFESKNALLHSTRDFADIMKVMDQTFKFNTMLAYPGGRV